MGKQLLLPQQRSVERFADRVVAVRRLATLLEECDEVLERRRGGRAGLRQALLGAAIFYLRRDELARVLGGCLRLNFAVLCLLSAVPALAFVDQHARVKASNLIRNLAGERDRYSCCWQAIVGKARELDLADPFATEVQWRNVEVA